MSEIEELKAKLVLMERQLEEVDALVFGWYAGPKLTMEKTRDVYEGCLKRQKIREKGAEHGEE